jgi:hypothetical protein
MDGPAGPHEPLARAFHPCLASLARVCNGGGAGPGIRVGSEYFATTAL